MRDSRQLPAFHSSTQDNIERRSAFRGCEKQFSSVIVSNYAPGEWKANAPSMFLCAEPRFEYPRAELAWNARAIVLYANAHPSFRQRLCTHIYLPSTAGKRIDCVLGKRLYRPF